MTKKSMIFPAVLLLFFIAVMPVKAEEETVLLDLGPFVIAHARNGTVVYTLDMAVRLVVRKNAEEQVRKDGAKLRSILLTAVSRYMEAKDGYETVKYGEIKEYMKSAIKSYYAGDGVSDILILTAYIR